MAANSSLPASFVSKEWTWFQGVQCRREWRIGWDNSCVRSGSVRRIARPRKSLIPGELKRSRPGFRGQVSTRLNDGSVEHNFIAGEISSPNVSEAEKLNHQAKCDVETVSWRERLIKASILVEATEDRLWEVLTDYERLAEFIPNLVCSERILCPYPGRIWLLQRGMQRTMYWNIEASVVLDLEELPHLEAGSELRFSMVDGDFKRYEGKWYLRDGPRPQTTMLHYEVSVVPRLFFPAPFLESIIKADLPKNLYAVAKRAERGLESEPTNSAVSKPVPLNGDLPTNLNVSAHSLSCSNIWKTNGIHLDIKPKGNDVQMHQSNVVHTAGKQSLSIRSSEQKEVSSADGSDLHWVEIGKTCQLGHHRVADEIHFRRLDDLLENGGVHRQVVATITVKAPLKDVWTVLCAYESLPEFVPNLTKSVVLFRENRRLQLLQEGCKCLLYMVLRARVILELVERPESEISFKQIEGDFDSFQGKWTLNQLGSQHTLLKYAVNAKIQKDCLLAESIVEEVIYEDIPSNLCALRDRVESLARSSGSHVGLSETAPRVVITGVEELTVPQWTPGSVAIEELPKVLLEESEPDLNSEPSADLNPQKGILANEYGVCARVQGLQDDFRVLEKEIRKFIAAYGNEGFMPRRHFVRQHGRVDLEKAITAMGGFATIAARMKLSLTYERRPSGYWGNLQTLRNEVIAFQKEVEAEPIMPTRRSMEISGRFDLARALEKWGGLEEVARISGLKMRGKKMQTRKNLTSPMTRNKRKKLLSRALSDKECLSTSSQSVHKDISQHPSNKGTSTSSDVSEESQALTEKDMTISSNSKEEHSPANNAMTSCGNQGKHKKMPYKTGVPQESSKWLTLFGDTQATLTNE